MSLSLNSVKSVKVIKKLIPPVVTKIAEKHKSIVLRNLKKKKKSSKFRKRTRKSTRKSRQRTESADKIVKRHILAVISSRLYQSIISAFFGTAIAAMVVSDSRIRQLILSAAIMNTKSTGLDYVVDVYRTDTTFYWLAVAAVSAAVQSVISLTNGDVYSRYKFVEKVADISESED